MDEEAIGLSQVQQCNRGEMHYHSFNIAIGNY